MPFSRAFLPTDWICRYFARRVCCPTRPEPQAPQAGTVTPNSGQVSGLEEAGPERFELLRLQAANGESFQNGLGDNGGDGPFDRGPVTLQKRRELLCIARVPLDHLFHAQGIVRSDITGRDAAEMQQQESQEAGPITAAAARDHDTSGRSSSDGTDGSCGAGGPAAEGVSEVERSSPKAVPDTLVHELAISDVLDYDTDELDIVGNLIVSRLVVNGPNGPQSDDRSNAVRSQLLPSSR